MQIKNKKKLIIICLLCFFLFNLNLNAEEFNIAAKEILIDKENEIIIGKGSVQAVDSGGKRINANKITYKKSREFLIAEGEVEITDIDGNIIETTMFQYDFISSLFSSIGKIKIIDIKTQNWIEVDNFSDYKKLQNRYKDFY